MANRPRMRVDQITYWEYWNAHRPDAALEIVKTGLGQHIVHHRNAKTARGYHVKLIILNAQPATECVRATKENLSRIGWQIMIVSPQDRTRYFLAPIECMNPPPAIGYHATEKWNVEKIVLEGLKPTGENERDPDMEGRICVCEKCADGGTECAAHWAKLLAEDRQRCVEDFSILEIDLSDMPGARIYQDLRSASGVVIDSIPSIPRFRIWREFHLSNGAWLIAREWKQPT